MEYKKSRMRTLIMALAILPPVASAQTMRGKVTLEDGSPPHERALIERVCQGGAPMQEAVAGKHGEFFWKLPNDDFSVMYRGARVYVRCLLRARTKDMESDAI